MRQQLQPIMGLGTWRALSGEKLTSILATDTKLRKGWDALNKKRAAMPAEERVRCLYMYMCMSVRM